MGKGERELCPRASPLLTTGPRNRTVAAVPSLTSGKSTPEESVRRRAALFPGTVWCWTLTARQGDTTQHSTAQHDTTRHRCERPEADPPPHLTSKGRSPRPAAASFTREKIALGLLGSLTRGKFRAWLSRLTCSSVTSENEQVVGPPSSSRRSPHASPSLAHRLCQTAWPFTEGDTCGMR